MPIRIRSRPKESGIALIIVLIDILAGIDLKNYPIYEADGTHKGTLAIDIKDLDRKFNINVADEVILRQALTLIGVDAGSISTIVGSVLDWRDLDSDPHMS